jgi:hypothetical protein
VDNHSYNDVAGVGVTNSVDILVEGNSFNGDTNAALETYSGGTSYLSMIGNNCYGCGASGITTTIQIGSGDTNILIENNTLSDNLGYGIQNTSNNVVIEGNSIGSTEDMGIYNTNGTNIKISDNLFNTYLSGQSATYGLALNTAGTSITISNNTFDDCNNVGIKLFSGETGVSIIGNTFIKGTYQNYNISSALNNVVFSNNILDPTATFSNTGTGWLSSNNQGYIATGEVRTLSGTITGTASDNGTVMASINNPFGQAVGIISIQLEIKGEASAAATLNAGVGSSASTKTYAQFFSALNLQPGTTYPYFYNSQSILATSVPINWATGGGNQYLNFSNPSANPCGTACSITFIITCDGE